MKKAFVLGLAMAAALAIPAGANRALAGQEAEKPDEQQELRTAIRADSPQAQVAQIRKFIAEHPKSDLLPVAREYLIDALVAAKAPSAELVAAGKEAIASAPEAFTQAMLKNQVAYELANRGEQLELAATWAAEAYAAIPEDNKSAKLAVRDTLGWTQVQVGQYDKAIGNLEAVAAVSGDDPNALYHLGMAYEKAGMADKAIDAYIRSETVFLSKNDVAAKPLRALYQKQHGSLDGLDAKLEAARKASREYVIFESRKWDKPAPEWELKDMAGKPVKLADFKGKVIVMDFWGSWCPPCRAELPKFQALYNKYKDNKNVAFLAMDWERPGEPEARMKAVTDFIAKNNYTFPVVIDHDRVAVKAYEIEGFPTVYLIDPNGMIRYRNLGYDEGVEEIIETQLETMLK